MFAPKVEEPKPESEEEDEDAESKLITVKEWLTISQIRMLKKTNRKMFVFLLLFPHRFNSKSRKLATTADMILLRSFLPENHHAPPQAPQVLR